MERSEEIIGEDATTEDPEEESSHPMDAFLEEEAYGLDTPRRGEIRKGTVARISESDILVDVGFKSEGIIPARELEQLPQEIRDSLTVGKEVTVYVLRTGGKSGSILLSIMRAREEEDWLEAERLQAENDIFEGEISGYNKGGLIVKLGRLRGFVPASQVSMSRRYRSEGDTPEKRWGDMLNEPIAVKVIEVDRRRNRLILSERAAAREARDLLKLRLIDELKPGEVRTGHVISLADFGAFVDIGGADGLVHTSEISWKRISSPRDVLKIGQEVQVKVLSVDPDQKRISLSIRELEADPWEEVVDQFQEGQLVEGTVTKLTKFGAFASLKSLSDYDVEGLIHISELSDRHVVHPREIVSEGETVTLRIIRIDRERRRIGLSLKKVDSPEYAELDWQAAMGELQSISEGEAGGEEMDVVSESPVDSGEVEAVEEVVVSEEPSASEPAEAAIPEIASEALERLQSEDLAEGEPEGMEESEVMTEAARSVAEEGPEPSPKPRHPLDQEKELNGDHHSPDLEGNEAQDHQDPAAFEDAKEAEPGSIEAE
jgi:small subunit ribosomal protein S1